MIAESLRVYADTSVFGGAFDAEFRIPSLTFFSQVKSGHFSLALSAVVRSELSEAPPKVRALYEEMLPLAEPLSTGEDAFRLAESYVKAGIVTPKSFNDALHVALATVSGCVAIVSWNFRHIVHFQKVPLYNAINRVRGYREIVICSPREVIAYEDEGF
jgi:predicted nucleic acid-binding protein